VPPPQLTTVSARTRLDHPVGAERPDRTKRIDSRRGSGTQGTLDPAEPAGPLNVCYVDGHEVGQDPADVKLLRPISSCSDG
jgi:prepilin-type processing-associated H-X9-DG protein